MAKTSLQSYLDDVKKELNPGVQLPIITQAEIDNNLDMIAIDHEDAIKMFQAGIITNMKLASILLNHDYLQRGK